MNKISKKIVIYFLISMFLASCSGSIKKNPVFELRAASSTPVSGYLKKINRKNEVIYIDRRNIIEDVHIKNAVAKPNDNGAPLLIITLTNAGEKILSKSTSKMIGERIAVMINGNIESTPVIRGEISKNIAVSVSSSERANDVIEIVNN